MLSSFQNLSLSKKLLGGVAIFLIPTAVLAYLLVGEKDDLIQFTRQEIVGVRYLEATHKALLPLAGHALTAAEAAPVEAALAEMDKGTGASLAVTDKFKDISAALKAEKIDAADALGKTTALISAVSDASNITLDPDMDAYFVGDTLVNQLPGVLVQAHALVQATHDLAAQKTDDNKIAFAEARDGLMTSAGNLATDLSKANVGETSAAHVAPSTKQMLDSAKAVDDAVNAMISAAKTGDAKAVDQAAVPLLESAGTYLKFANVEMGRLLDTRVDGFHADIMRNLLIAFVCLLIGALISWRVVRSVTQPLAVVIGLIGKLTQGQLDIILPQANRTDEIGSLMMALRSFHSAALDRDNAQSAERERVQKERVRAERVQKLNAEFNESVRKALSGLSSAVGQLKTTADVMARGTEESSMQASKVAAAAEQASANVQTVASAAEELSASVHEISTRIGESAVVSSQAAQEARQVRVTVDSLSTEATKIGDVVGLISQIASQTNLLALNATIEAARAGDAGKGFAVVASEVKTLANQTAQATEDITSLISAIQKSVHDVKEAMGHIDSTITKINEISVAISGAVEEQGAATREIARNVSEASQGTRHVTANIVGIAGGISEIKNEADHVLDAAKVLDLSSEGLRKDIGSYLASVQAG